MKTEILRKQHFIVALKTAMFCLAFFMTHMISGQQENISCNEKNPFTPDSFSVDQVHSDTLKSFWQNGNQTPANLVNNNPNDYARAHIKQTGWVKARVFDTDSTVEYEAGVFAGFLIRSNAFENGEFFSVTINTYLNGVLRESYTGAELTAFSSTFLNDPIALGFITTMTFNQIEVIIDTSLGMALYDVYYAILERFCESEPSECNTPAAVNNPGYPVLINYALSGSGSASEGYVDNPEGAISASVTDYATLTHLADVAGHTYISVQDQLGTFDVNTFLGFDIYNTGMISTDLLSYLTVESYLDGVLQESYTGSELSLLGSLSVTSGRQTVGFLSTLVADEIRLSIEQDLLVDLGSTRVYSAVIQRFCEGAAIGCNTLTYLHNPLFPVIIDGAHTGISGVVCVLCDVRNTGNVIDADTTNYASIILTAGVGATGSISVENVLATYPAGTFAGYHIDNSSLADLSLLSGVNITTYLNGVVQDSATGSPALISIGSDLLVDDGHHIIGLVTTEPFDAVAIRLTNTVTIDLGTTNVYGVVIDSLCGGTIGCDSTYFMTNPTFPVIIDAGRTGIDGVVCAGCSVQNEWNVITEDPDDYATIVITAGVLADGSIAVHDPTYTYPGGIVTGFAIEDVNALVEAQLFGSLTISTYNNGILQESASGIQLLDVSVSFDWVEPGTGIYNVGMTTTLPFDEVRITVGSLVGINNTINVYGFFMDTENLDPILCAALPVTWLSFDVRRENLQSRLTWTTAREFNNAGYEVQRSPDGRFFSTIGRVDMTGSDDVIHSYSFTDDRPVMGMNYYRVKQTDLDGRYTYSQVRSISFDEGKQEVLVWPNPVSDILTIRLEKDHDAGVVRMINTTGAVIREIGFKKYEGIIEWNVSDLESGHYNLIIETSKDRTVQKIVILR